MAYLDVVMAVFEEHVFKFHTSKEYEKNVLSERRDVLFKLVSYFHVTPHSKESYKNVFVEVHQS